MNLQAFLNTLNNQPENLQFTDTMAIIEALYDFAPTSFKNGHVDNGAGQNNGSCKLFAFAKLQNLNEQQTLNCFGAYYREDVLKNPEGTDHQNIRNFMQTGWAGVEFAGQALTEK
jgi:hypothetical protein